MPRISSYHRALLVMLAPFMVGMVMLIIVPALMAAPLAFTSYDALAPAKWIGLDNFLELRNDEQFWSGLSASVLLVLVAVPLRVLGTLGLAVMMRVRRRYSFIFSGAVYLPTVIPSVAYAMVWLYILNPLYGPLNFVSYLFASPAMIEMARRSGPNAPGLWLIDGQAAQVAVIIMLLFTIGEGFVLLLAAMREIPLELYEVAAIDGASPWQQFRNITLPMLVPALTLLSLRDTIYVLQASFSVAFIVTQGGPYYATTYLPYWIYLHASEFLQIGYASAMNWVLYGLTAVLVVTQFWALHRWREL